MAIAFLRGVAAAARSKYRNRRVTVDGKRFDSQREANRWCTLLLLERAGTIYGLERQKDIPLHCLGNDGQVHVIGKYVADFTYWIGPEGLDVGPRQRIVEDAKGVRTELYLWKRKHLALEYGVQVLET